MIIEVLFELSFGENNGQSCSLMLRSMATPMAAWADRESAIPKPDKDGVGVGVAKEEAWRVQELLPRGIFAGGASSPSGRASRLEEEETGEGKKGGREGTYKWGPHIS